MTDEQTDRQLTDAHRTRNSTTDQGTKPPERRTQDTASDVRR